MLKDLGLDLDLTRSKRPFKVQLALPSKVITQNISNINTANISDVKLNSLPHFEFEIPYLVESKNKGVTDEIEYIKNPDLDSIKEEKLIKLTWYGGRVNWFRIITIEKNDSSDGITTKISCDSLESELRTTNVTIDGTGVGAEEYFKKTLEQSPWKLGHISNKLKNTYRTFSEQDKQTRYEAIQSGIEAYGAITDFDGETRTLNLLTIDELRVFRGVVLKRENYANSIDISSTSEEIVTRMYAKGNEDLDISSANPTGMRYIEDFSYFIQPFKRDEHKNVLHHSNYMSDDLAHALLDLMELQKVYNPKIDNLQKLINQGYVDLTKKMSEKDDLDGEMITLQALLDTAKSTNNKSLTAQRESEIIAKQKQVDDKSSEIDSINKTIEVWNKTIVGYQEIISTNSFRADLVEELKLFVYEKDFSDDRYIDAKELYKATVEEFEKYQKPTRSFKTDLASFINSIESKKYHGRLEIGEEVKIKSNKLEEEYTSIIIGYSGDLVSGDFQLEISDNMDDIDALDRLATIIYQAESSSSILENNKYKWNNIVEVKDEVTAWRDKEIKAVDNRIVAGANESITLDNHGMMVRNPDFPNEVIIIQSGVVALSKDNGKTWNTSITPNGVIAETLIGKILAGNNLIITNDSGSFVIDNTGLTVNMDSIKIMSGHEGNPKNVIESWNKLLLTYDEIANDNLINEYEKKQLKNQWTKITDIHSSMISSFMKGRGKPTKENPYPDEYNEYVTAYEDLNKYLNQTQQSDGYSILNDANITKTTTIDPEVFKEKFINYDKKKQALESIISFDYTKSEIKTLETGISLNYVKNDNVVTALNLSEEGVKIDGKLLEINSKTEFNADLVMNAGVIKGKDDGIIINLNTGEIKLNKKVTIGADSNLVTHDDITPLKGTIVSTLSNDFITIFTDPNGSSGNYDYASTEMNVYRDGVLDTSNWTFSVERNNNVVYTVSKNTVKVLSTKTDFETIVIVATQGKETLKKEFKVKKYKDTSGNINRWMLTSDSLRKTPYDEWVNTPITVLGNQELVGGDTTEYRGRYKVYESKDGGLNYFLKYTSSSDESIVTYKPFDNDITHVKLQFYLAGGTLNLIDEQILPVIIDRNKAYTHTAYSYSADGTDSFTTVYPNLNLLDGTKDFSGSWLLSENWTNDRTYKGLTVKKRTYQWGGIHKTFTAPKDGTYTFSAYVKSSGNNANIHRFISLNNADYLGAHKELGSDFDWFRDSFTVTLKAGDVISARYEISGSTSDSILWTAGHKWEEGSVATPHMPSKSEVETSDYPSYIGTYSDDKVSDSVKPSDYTWSLMRGNDGKDGATGKDGIAGKDGNGIKNTVITYAISTSGTTAPNTGWTSSVPSLVKGQYLWTKTIWTYTDSSSETGYSVTYIAKDGNNGHDGIAGKDGVGIKTTTITYASHTNGTTPPTTGYTTTVPSVPAGQFLWTKTIWTYTDNSSETGYSVAMMGEKGPKGDQGIQGLQGPDGTQGIPGKPGADGETPYFHTAWAYSSDGTDRFSTVYPNLNLLDKTNQGVVNWDWTLSDGDKSVEEVNVDGIRAVKLIKGTTTANTGWNLIQYAGLLRNLIQPSTQYVLSFDVKPSVDVSFIATLARTEYQKALTDDVTMNKASANQWTKVSCVLTSKETLPDDLSQIVYLRGMSTANGNWLIIKNIKLEPGSVATPHMPSKSEVKTSDYPNYIGQYTNDKKDDSTNPSDYVWSLFKGQDSNAYTAYSWSSDGTDRFSTVYPNLNLLDGTKDFSGDWEYISGYDNDGTYKGLAVKKRTYQWGGIHKTFTAPKSGVYTFSAYVKSSGSTATIYRFVNCWDINGHEKWLALNAFMGNSFDWLRDSFTVNLKTGDTLNPRYEISGAGTDSIVWTAGHKWEEGSTATPWTPSQSESQAQWQDAIPMYVGVGEKDSQNPSDYRWQLNPRYVQASSDSGLSNKAGLDDLESVAETANDALVQAQNAVSNEDYTSWLEHDYQSTIDNLHAVSTQNKEDINNVNDRTTIVEGFYDRMKVKWNFINESFTFSEEGMFISNKQSKMAIQVTSDKIVFWDNNVDVAFITGEVLNIQKGVFLESATIGNHLITKFSNESPVTIIRYVGGIT
ncbi:capsid and scaffold protein [Lactococcus phage P1048]|uniref:Capsid and scaffold protein n=1 Tax=Lactococcus phage P1048 TaxID=2662295 RepID=A0A649V304_9CAUD|nr:tail protein [Lactococcus phage P1048]QGJ85022.1 capsid and scaffold protein [Lactococcus phage P1048]